MGDFFVEEKTMDNRDILAFMAFFPGWRADAKLASSSLEQWRTEYLTSEHVHDRKDKTNPCPKCIVDECYRVADVVIEACIDPLLRRDQCPAQKPSSAARQARFEHGESPT